jgi:integrase
MEEAVGGISPPPVTRFRKQSGRRRDGLWLDTRTPGKPVWCVRYKGLDGKPHRERTEARTREQALALLHQRTSEILKARIVGVHSLDALQPKTFAEFLEKEYLPHCKATHTTATYNGDRSLAALLGAHFGKMLLRSISSGDLQRYVDQQASRIIRAARPARDPYGKILKDKEGKTIVLPPVKVRPATVNRHRTFLSGILSEAERRGYIDRNPARGVSNLPEHNDNLRWLTNAEEERLLAHSPQYLRPIILVALHTGMRRGEVLTLKWADLDFEQNLVRVVHTKNHHIRYIPMNTRLKNLLESIKPELTTWEETPFVFWNVQTENAFKNLSKAVKSACNRAGLQEVTFHTLRHTFASRLAQAKVPINVIRELLGHGDMQVTMRYAHLAPSNLREAVQLLVKEGFKAEKRTRSVQARG